jgi:hypothetical protein
MCLNIRVSYELNWKETNGEEGDINRERERERERERDEILRKIIK